MWESENYCSQQQSFDCAVLTPRKVQVRSIELKVSSKNSRAENLTLMSYERKLFFNAPKCFSFTASKSAICFDKCELVIMLWLSGISYQSSFYTSVFGGFMEKELKGMCGSVSNYILAMTCRLALHLHELPGAPLAKSKLLLQPVCLSCSHRGQSRLLRLNQTLFTPFRYIAYCYIISHTEKGHNYTKCAFWWMTFPGVMHLASDDEITAKLSNSSHLTPNATHQLRTHPASLPADNTPSLQLISVCGWYSLGTCNPVQCMQIYSSSSSLSCLLLDTLHEKDL